MPTMKKIFFIAALLAGNTSFCQSIPNPGFESWSTAGMFLAPDGWAGSPGVIQSTQSHTGTYALQCTVDTFTNPRTAALDTVVGSAYSGAATMGPPAPGSNLNGFALATRPDSLTGWFKFHAMGPDTAAVVITISKWSVATNSRLVVGQAVYPVMQSDSVYRRFSMALQYANDSMPDTCVIQVLSANPTAPRHMGTSIWVDDLAFTNVPSAIESVAKTGNITAWPVPFTDVLTVAVDAAEIKEISLYNIAGVAVVTTTNPVLHTSGIPAGIYLLRAITNNGEVSRLEVLKK